MAGGDEKDKPSPHTLADHLYGEWQPHEHGPDADHDHDDFELAGPIEDNPIWVQDNVTLTSVGIDIGSAGTQIVFSRVHLRRHGEDLTSRYVVVEREAIYQSPIGLTPYRDETRIDEAALGALIDRAYGEARLHPDDIDTGVVILTGEALRRENAQSIAAILAEQGGEFVCATAGHHMEAMLAAYGSGAARLSHDRGERLLNIDVGGGTTKLGLVEGGRVLATAAIHIGGRLQVVDGEGRITRLDPAGRHHAAAAGFDWALGDLVAEGDLDRVAEIMADTLVAALTERPVPEAASRLTLTDPIGDLDGVRGMLFSGGVAEYVYDREAHDFGDMGRRLGRALRARAESGALPWPLLPAHECIRATALGASEYSIQLSGNTSYISNPRALLPRRNLQVVQPDFAVGEADAVDAAGLAAAIREHLVAFDLDGAEGDLALALQWAGHPDYARIRAFAEGIRDGLAERLARGLPLYLMLDGDVALTLGSILRDELGVANEILAIDGVVLWDFDYIDLGRIRLPSHTVPVTIKSLVFSEDPRGPRRRERLHHHGDGHHHHYRGDGRDGGSRD
ncbi:MAG: recombinase [Inquilinus sp.]|nr:recombinase [Inquilinus sp.]